MWIFVLVIFAIIFGELPYITSEGNKADSDFKIVCENFIRQSDEEADLIDTDLCTHVDYYPIEIGADNVSVQFENGWTGFEQRYSKQIATLKEKGVKVSFHMNDNAKKLAQLARGNTNHQRFAQNIVEFIGKHGFDGLCLKWRRRFGEKENNINFIKALSDAFKPKGLLLSLDVFGWHANRNNEYAVPEMSKFFDWAHIKFFQLHNHTGNYSNQIR